MITRLERTKDSVLGFAFSGKLHDEDYQHFVPTVDAAIAAHGKVRLLIHLVDFQGADMHALWDDTKFTATHYAKLDRFAVVGDKRWQEWMAKACKPFTLAQVRYFDAAQIDTAWAWLEEKA